MWSSGNSFDEGPREGGPYGPYVQSERKSIYLERQKVSWNKEMLIIAFVIKKDQKHVTFMGTKRYDKHCLSYKEEVQRRLDAEVSHMLLDKTSYWRWV